MMILIQGVQQLTGMNQKINFKVKDVTTLIRRPLVRCNVLRTDRF